MKIKQVNNLSNNEYHNSEKYRGYWSSSNLKVYPESPKEAHFQKFTAEKKESNAMDFGSCSHDLLASKHINGQSFEWNIFEPPINPSTKSPYGKDTKRYKDALIHIDNPISSDDMELINDLWSMIKSSQYAWFFEKEILGKGIAEPSFFIESYIHKYKTRLDVLTDKFIFDYKFICKKDFYGDLNRIIKRYGYHISGSMYQYFEYKHTGIWKPFRIIWIMKEPPFDILIDDMSMYCYEMFSGQLIKNEGAIMFEALKDQHEACEITKQWPGLANKYPKIDGIRLAQSAPKYQNHFNEFEIED